VTAANPWEDFTEDPRRPETARLRASDRDRAVVLGVLTDGFAEGRITRQEYDERAGAATTAKTLGQLPELILDLVPLTVRPSQEDLQALAVQHWEATLRHAVTWMLVPSLVCWAIWLASGWGQGEGFEPGFAWPVLVTLWTGLRLVRVATHKEQMVLEERRRLEKRRRKELDG
jgi:hypothetical protein